MKVYKSKNRIVIKNRYGTLIMQRRTSEGAMNYRLYRNGFLVRSGGDSWIEHYRCDRQLRTVAKILVKHYCSPKTSVYEATMEIRSGEHKGNIARTAFLRPADMPLPQNVLIDGIEYRYRLLM